MTSFELVEMIKKHEGLSLKPYKDTVGKLTIGYGRNLDDRGLSEKEARYLLSNDVLEAMNEAKTFSWYSYLSSNRQAVIVNMIFNLGLTKFKTFKNMISAIEKRDYKTAAAEMLNSKWAEQVKSRAVMLSRMMENA